MAEKTTKKEEEQDPNLKVRVEEPAEAKQISTAEIASGSVLMVHKEFPKRDPVEVSRRVFEGTWKDLGWVQVGEGEPLQISSPITGETLAESEEAEAAEKSAESDDD